jgi:hypothetical protein
MPFDLDCAARLQWDAEWQPSPEDYADLDADTDADQE